MANYKNLPHAPLLALSSLAQELQERRTCATTAVTDNPSPITICRSFPLEQRADNCVWILRSTPAQIRAQEIFVLVASLSLISKRPIAGRKRAEVPVQVQIRKHRIASGGMRLAHSIWVSVDRQLRCGPPADGGVRARTFRTISGQSEGATILSCFVAIRQFRQR